MKKFLSMLLMLALVITMTTGCMQMTGSIVANEDNSISIHTKVYFDKEIIDNNGNKDVIMGNTSDLKVETIDGKEYYVDEEDETYSQKELKKEFSTMLIDKNRFYYGISQEGLLENNGDTSINEIISKDAISYVGMDVTLQAPVTKTNGTISEDNNNTVHWEIKPGNEISTEWYAYTDDSKYTLEKDRKTVKALYAEEKEKQEIANDKTAPVIKGVTNGKTYKKSVNVYIKDNVKLKSIKLNNKSVKLTSSILVKSGKYKNYYKVKVTKKGKNKIIAQDAAGNKKTVSFKIKK